MKNGIQGLKSKLQILGIATMAITTIISNNDDQQSLTMAQRRWSIAMKDYGQPTEKANNEGQQQLEMAMRLLFFLEHNLRWCQLW